jgi:hypothetical protein
MRCIRLLVIEQEVDSELDTALELQVDTRMHHKQSHSLESLILSIHIVVVVQLDLIKELMEPRYLKVMKKKQKINIHQTIHLNFWLSFLLKVKHSNKNRART